MKILITGFRPFGGDKMNPSLASVERLKSHYGQIEVIATSLPVVFHQSISELDLLMEQHQPDIVICTGQATGRAQITVERVGINIDDARIEDNAGNAPIDTPVVIGGPAAYFSNLPIKAMVHAMRESGVPAAVSNTAGTYVCNHILYGVMHLIHTKYPHVRGGFIHVPSAPEQVVDKANIPSMSIEMMVYGLEAALIAAANYTDDLQKSEGVTC